VSASGEVVWKAAYLPFGEAQIITETVANNIRFPGQYFDAETGLHYNWYRYYDPNASMIRLILRIRPAFYLVLMPVNTMEQMLHSIML